MQSLPGPPPTRNRSTMPRTRSLITAIQAVADARRQRDAYERALRDYHALMRHRIATPLTVIRGASETLLNVETLGETDRIALLRAIEGAAQALEAVALDPQAVASEESELGAVPGIGVSVNNVS